MIRRAEPSRLHAHVDENEPIARRLDEVADRLEQQEANPFRIEAYRRGAEVVRELHQPIHDIVTRHGLAGLKRYRGIGDSLAQAIAQLATDDDWPLLERLRGEAEPERLLMALPGVGPELARRIHDRLGVESLEELELAAWDGRLAQVEGMGPRRLRAIRDSLEARFGRRQRRRRPVGDRPAVAELLDVDREYRTKAEAGRLRTIRPRRFNPEGDAWLPILHTRRDERQYTALYSNTRRAHELGRERDWVVIYREDDAGTGQWTVVTATRGPLQGRRVVRGRETECETYYASQTDAR
ncbi:MAG: helix-hairpin-helix domain-containing protein [Phycisphaeraceae bacterium]